ncbi:MAG: ABC transporter ATP-binding protein [Candidatus Ranarchaeia archaeon]
MDDGILFEGKDPSSWTVAKWLIGKLTESKLLFFTVIVATCLASIIYLMIPLTIGFIIGDILNSPNTYSSLEEQFSVLAQSVFFLLFIGIGRGLLEYLTTFANETMAWRTERSVRAEFYRSIQAKPVTFHDLVRTGEIMALATNDTRQINVMLSPGLRMIAELVVNAVGITVSVYLTGINPLLLIATIPFIPIYAWSVRHYSRKLAPISKTFQQKFARISTAAQDNLEGIRIVRAFGSEEYEKKKFYDVINDFKITWTKRQSAIARYYPTLVLDSCIGVSFIFGLFLLSQGSLNVGELVAFNGLLMTLIVPTFLISWAITMAQSGFAGATRIYKTMHSIEAEEILEKGNGCRDIPPDFKGEIVFDKVTFAYPDDPDHPVLNNISFKVRPGQVVAIVGPTGSGKSTLTKLLLRLYDLDGPGSRGRILIDGVNIKEYKLESLRRNIGRIEQDIFIFSKSIRENIIFGCKDATDEMIREAADLAQAHDFITGFKDGYETVIGERGVTLSGGQRQRIAIARTFITDPRILVLDDSTSSIDSRTEERIITAIENLLKDRTTFVITHRLSMIRKADLILVLKEGHIVASGRHQDLIRRSKHYRRIFGRRIPLPPLQGLSPDIASDTLVEGA